MAPAAKKSKVSASDVQSHINDLERINEQLLEIDQDLAAEIKAVQEKYNAKKRPLFEKRDKAASNIPNFWADIFESHPSFGEILSEFDLEVLQYMTDLKVTEGDNDAFKVEMFFKENPHFENASIFVNVTETDGAYDCQGSTIKWKSLRNEGEEAKKGDKRKSVEDLEEISFLSMFKDPMESLELLLLIKEDIYTEASGIFLASLNGDDEEDEDAK